MKKSVLLFCFVSVALILSAQTTSNLTISTTGTSNLKITFNGRNYSLPDRSTTFQSLNPGTYPLIIYQWQLKSAVGQYEKVYDGTVRLTAGKHLEMLVMRYGKTSWDEGEITKDDWSNNYIIPQPAGNTGNSSSENSNGAMSASQFSLLKKTMENEYNEEKKLELAKVIFKNNLFTLAQIKDLCAGFYNEDRKLNFVKFSYDYCVEKSVFFSLSDLFYSTARKKELIDFLATK